VAGTASTPVSDTASLATSGEVRITTAVGFSPDDLMSHRRHTLSDSGSLGYCFIFGWSLQPTPQQSLERDLAAYGDGSCDRALRWGAHCACGRYHVVPPPRHDTS
jgi:hypothetical protein